MAPRKTAKRGTVTEEEAVVSKKIAKPVEEVEDDIDDEVEEKPKGRGKPAKKEVSDLYALSYSIYTFDIKFKLFIIAF